MLLKLLPFVAAYFIMLGLSVYMNEFVLNWHYLTPSHTRGHYDYINYYCIVRTPFFILDKIM